MHAASRMRLATCKRSYIRRYGCFWACLSSNAPAPEALPSIRRTLHSPALEWNLGDVRAVTRLPRGMVPFQSSGAAEGPGQQHGAAGSRSDGGAHLSRALISTTASEGALSSSAQPKEQLPPWPVDAFEFNAVAAHGGHDVRKLWGTISPPSDSATPGVSGDRSTASTLTGAAAVPGASSSLRASTSGPIPKLPVVTVQTIRQLKTVEETAEAQRALRGGGWVCTECWSIVHADCGDNTDNGASSSVRLSLFPRSICPACHTLRHDARTWSYIASLRLRSDLWQCGCCGEANAGAAASCRCCRVARTEKTGGADGAQHKALVRVTVADEVYSCPVGHVVVTRNRTTRWRCGSCREINSLQMAVCRNCARERFAVTVSCPTCDAPRALSNAVVFGGEAETRATRRADRHTALGTVAPSSADAGDAVGGAQTAAPNARLADPPSFPARVFGPENCYTPASTQLSCLQCCSPLHGGRVTSVSAAGSWWCACGVVNAVAAYSCLRCRLPRALECPEKLSALLRSAVSESASASPPLSEHGAGAASHRAATSPTWDFRSCTNWMCDSCCGVNTASHQVVAEGNSSPSPSATCSENTKHSRRLCMRHGDAVCRHCGAPWHHQLLQEGNSWRCACHALNSRTDALCTSCGLPALDGIRLDVLSSWSKGDWRCPKCGSLCYRSRQRCSCGTPRASVRLSSET
ncbi:hypothetical protein LSCM4_05813 [Leishmania orientalis]|uniref:RanBP2-type domain-containing protein n=1 Tax=Leishmania orientalis TaxID=2249476 RepID=A0A836H919_9TRYP|nr:hypothetical protein LSCM4_05813 [Leishmania orientalis]